MRNYVKASKLTLVKHLISTTTTILPFDLFSRITYNKKECTPAPGGPAELLVGTMQRYVLTAVHVGLITGVRPQSAVQTAIISLTEAIPGLTGVIHWTNNAHGEEHHSRDVTISFPVFYNVMTSHVTAETVLLSVSFA